MAETLHVAIMPDGNRRWATQQGIADNQVAYRKAVRRLLEISNTAFAEGVTHLTLWASSCDNRHRRTGPWNLEVSELLRKAVHEFAECDANLDIIGEWRDLESQENIEAYLEASEISRERLSDRRLTLLIDYNGDREIGAAIQSLHHTGRTGFPNPENAVEALKNASWTKDLPDVDFLIRSGACRDPHNSANFLPLLTGNAQYCFSSELWPAYSVECFLRDMDDFRSRERRLGR